MVDIQYLQAAHLALDIFRTWIKYTSIQLVYFIVYHAVSENYVPLPVASDCTLSDNSM